jgi:Caspase domain
MATKRLALVIGISNYTQLRPLPNARFEAATMAAELSENDFDVDTVPNNMLGRGEGSALEDRPAIVNALDRFAAKVRDSPGCTALIYYAGHGAMMSPMPGADQVLMGCDWPGESEKMSKRAKVENFGYTIGAKSIQELLAEAGRIVLLLDTCRTTLKACRSYPDRIPEESSLDPKMLLAYACYPNSKAAEHPQGTYGSYSGLLVEVQHCALHDCFDAHVSLQHWRRFTS